MWNVQKIWILLRSSLWFIPAMSVVFCIGLAVGMIEVDRAFAEDLQDRWPRLFGVSPEGARGLLTAIATSMITVAGVVFSIVIVALSIASNQYTPRILRIFMKDRGTQSVLGFFVALFAYSLLVLRTVRSGETPFVPVAAISLAIVLALISIGFLVYFIHHIAASIQAPTMIAGICAETINAIEHLFPACQADKKPEGADVSTDGHTCVTVTARETGYLQSIDEGIAELAHQHDVVVFIERKIGEFVVKGAPLLSVSCKQGISPKLESRMIRGVAIDSFRTVDQDPSYGIRQLVDIALKALSPGVNDTSTAANAVDYIGAILFSLVQRESMPHRIPCQGRVRVIYRRCLNVERLLNVALLQVRQSARGNPAILLRLLKIIGGAASVARKREYKQFLAKHLALIEEAAMESVSSKHDLAAIMERLRCARELCAK